MAELMEVCAKLDTAQRTAILDRFCKLNPHWRGAHVEDIIDTLVESDSDLDRVERAWDDFPQMHKPGFASAIRALIWSGTDVSETTLRKLLD